MPKFPPTTITRRNCLQLLLAAGSGVLAAGVLRALQFDEKSSETSIDTTQVFSDRIKNVVIFIQENHSFDSLFAGFPGANGRTAERECTDSLRGDPPHSHVDALRTDGATTEESRCSYTETNAPNYWKAARAFTLCDYYFSDVRGPSHPNYLMMIAGQSPIVNAPLPSDVCPDFCLDIPVLPNQLDVQGLTWRDYGGIFTSIKGLRLWISRMRDFSKMPRRATCRMLPG